MRPADPRQRYPASRARDCSEKPSGSAWTAHGGFSGFSRPTPERSRRAATGRAGCGEATGACAGEDPAWTGVPNPDEWRAVPCDGVAITTHRVRRTPAEEIAKLSNPAVIKSDDS